MNKTDCTDEAHSALARRLREGLPAPEDGHFVAQVMARTHTPRRRSVASLRYGVAALATLCAVALLRVSPPVQAPEGLQARGGTVAARNRLGVELYAHPGGQPAVRRLLHGGES